MLGAIIGDIAGSKYEFHPLKSKNFKFLPWDARFTDDTVMTCAVAAACIEYCDNGRDISLFEQSCIKNMQMLGREFPNAGYGPQFLTWLKSSTPTPYGSWGNGSAMRVSPVAWIASTLEEAQNLAEASARITHNDPDGIRGALAIASACYMALHDATKPEIRKYFSDNYYRLDFSLNHIRPDYAFDVSCMGSVPQAVECFLEGIHFEDTIRNAISLGGDSDTIGSMSGSIAECFFGISNLHRDMASIFIGGTHLGEIVEKFENRFGYKEARDE